MNGCKHEDSEEIRKAYYYYHPSAAANEYRTMSLSLHLFNKRSFIRLSKIFLLRR
jgi:hypothetical protein